MGMGQGAEYKVGEIQKKTRRKYSAEGNTRILLEGIRGQENMVAFCRRQSAASNTTGVRNFRRLASGV